MVTIGWMSDSHVDPNTSSHVDRPGAREELVTDITTLFEEYEISDLYFNGDGIADNEAFFSDRYEHSTPDYYRLFWELIDSTGYGDNVIYSPGNHDVPLQYFVESDPRARLRFKKRYEEDGVTVLMVNTAGPGWVSGSPRQGYGWTSGYVSYNDLRWLDAQLNSAGDDAKVVYFHHHAWLTPGDPLASSPTDSQTSEQFYWVCRNHREVHRILSSYNDVICPQGHTNQYSDEGSSRVDGVEYLYKKHYYNTRDGSLNTFAYIDVDRNRCTVTTVEHDDGEENEILDVTF